MGFIPEFTIREGNKLCMECDTALGLKAHNVFWQLFIEKKFILRIVKELQTSNKLVSDKDSSPRQLTNVEENAIRYAAGFVIRKLLKYCKKKTQKEVECCRVLNEMASKAVHTIVNSRSEVAGS